MAQWPVAGGMVWQACRAKGPILASANSTASAASYTRDSHVICCFFCASFFLALFLVLPAVYLMQTLAQVSACVTRRSL